MIWVAFYKKSEVRRPFPGEPAGHQASYHLGHSPRSPRIGQMGLYPLWRFKPPKWHFQGCSTGNPTLLSFPPIQCIQRHFSGLKRDGIFFRHRIVERYRKSFSRLSGNRHAMPRSVPVFAKDEIDNMKMYFYEIIKTCSI